MKLSNFHPGCHGIPERCFKIRGKAMPFCARCLGASIGHLTGIAAYVLGKPVTWHYLPAGLMIMLADWTLQNKLNAYQSNIARLFTGVLGGSAVAGLSLTLIQALRSIG